MAKGTPHLRFDWMLMAKQKGYAMDRLEDFIEKKAESFPEETNYSEELSEENIYSFYREEIENDKENN